MRRIKGSSGKQIFVVKESTSKKIGNVLSVIKTIISIVGILLSFAMLGLLIWGIVTAVQGISTSIIGKGVAGLTDLFK